MLPAIREKSIFFSDVHIEPSTSARMQHVYHFLENVVANYTNIFILGDLFDVWPGSRKFQFKVYEKYLDILKKMVDSGRKVLWIEGNHDFLLGEQMAKRIAIEIVSNETVRQFGNYKVHLSHGDLANVNDKSYLRLRKLLRQTPLHIALGLLPSAWVYEMGNIWSTQSRKRHVRTAEKLERIRGIYRDAAKRICADGYDMAIFGHTHIPDDFKFSLDGRNCRYLNLGEWFYNFSYVEFDGTEFYTKKYQL